MNKVITIDSEKCIGCGLCTRDCPAGHIKVTDKKAVVNEGSCIECGHCYAICPTGAVAMNGYDLTGCDNVVSMTEISADTLLAAMKSRRSVRQFKSTPVEQEKIDKILEAGRYSPTGGNAQDVRFTVLGGKQDEIEKKCVKLFRTGTNAAKPVLSIVRNVNIDDSFFFKGAPLVIVVSAKSNVNGGLASAYMELVANSLGLGVLYSGFFQMCSKLSPSIRNMLELPKGEKVVSCMVIGYPAVNYQRIAPRKPMNFNKLK